MLKEFQRVFGLGEDQQLVGLGVRLDAVDATEGIFYGRATLLASSASSGTATASGALTEQAVELFSHLDGIGVSEGEQFGGAQISREIPFAGDEAINFPKNRRFS